MRCDKSSPSTSSMHERRARRPLSSARRCAAMFGWFSDASDFGFALKAREPIGVSRERRRQDLDRDLALQLRVGRAIHLAHAALADLRGDFVDAEAGAGSEGQRLEV